MVYINNMMGNIFLERYLFLKKKPSETLKLNEAYFEPSEMVVKEEIIRALQEKIAHAIIQFWIGISD